MIKGVPYDAEIAYLQSTGTQWIDTGVACAFDYTYTIVAGHNELTAGASALFGVAWAVRSVFVQMGISPNDFYWHGINPSQYYSFTNGGMDTISFGNGFVTINGTTTTGTAYLNANTGLPITLFGNAAYYGSTTGLAKVRIGRFTITNANNKKILDLIPVRVGQVGYLYDRVTRRLFGNAGTGAFTLGPDVATPVMSLHRMAQTQISTPIEWTDGYRYISGGSTDAATGKSVTNTYIPIIGNHTYTVLCGAGGTTNRYAALYTSVYGVQESVAESKSNETFTFTPAYQSSVYLRYTCNTDAKADTYVHDDTDDKYIVKNGRVLS